ncbi:MAG: adenosine kinase [Proteobacteria bacterium]|nr:adenosine kinase [Pseudomonadota bacterium]
MKSIDVSGVCNGIVDIFTDVTEQDFASLGFEKGAMRLVEASDQQELLSRLGTVKPVMVSGGSVANSLIAISQLGGTSAVYCRLADDEYGRFYHNECLSLGMKVPVPLASEGATGTCVVIITPDAERTLRTALGACTTLADTHIESEIIADSRWLFIEGYVFSNSDQGRAAIKRSIDIASKSDTKVAVTCSDAWVVHGFATHLEQALEQTDLIFANEEEAAALSNTKEITAAGRVLKERFPHVVLTAGARGAYIWWQGEELHVPAFPSQPRDLTGAGDMFAGAFLYGINYGLTPFEAARRACYLAHHVISQVGARLNGDVKKLWNS